MDPTVTYRTNDAPGVLRTAPDACGRNEATTTWPDGGTPQAEVTAPSGQVVSHVTEATRRRPLARYLPLWGIDIAEDVIHAVIAFVLIALALVVLSSSVTDVLHTRPFFPEGVITAINDVLFVIIILEILRTVTAHFREGGLQIGPFLIIGIISAVRHMLTVSASLTLEGDGSPMHFNHAMVELTLNGGLVLILVIGLVLLHLIGDPTISLKSGPHLVRRSSGATAVGTGGDPGSSTATTTTAGAAT
jgi:uncharacterized membrane protein (DUF373 family)